MNRREMLQTAGLLAGSAAANAIAQTSSGSTLPTRKLKIIVTGGHPGDPEYGCGGTIARLTDLGHDVVLLYLNNGVTTGRPMDGVRVSEAGKACEILKARPLFAGQVDGDAVIDRAHHEVFRKLMESEKPD